MIPSDRRPQPPLSGGGSKAHASTRKHSRGLASARECLRVFASARECFCPSLPSQGEGQKHSQALANTREHSRVLASARECLLVLASACECFCPSRSLRGRVKSTRRGRGASDGHKVVTWWSPRGGRNNKIMISVWGWSILVNGILYLRLFSHLDITSSKYRNVEFTSFLAQTCASHLGSCITCCYMAPCVFGHFDACLGGFIRGFGHPRRHTCLRENAFFGFTTWNSVRIKEKYDRIYYVLLLLYSFFSVCP